MFEYLVLLEVQDEEIASLIGTLRSIFGGKRSRTPIHVTVRGPYVKPLDSDRLAKWMARIEKDVLLISGAGRFKFDDGYAAFLKVSTANKTANLSRITRKHDYPKVKYGFNPHITIYSGPSRDIADAAFAFLKHERIEVLCRKFDLGVHALSRQYALFPIFEHPSSVAFNRLIERDVIKPGIIERARQFASLAESQVGVRRPRRQKKMVRK